MTKTFTAVCTLIGAVVGAGFLGIPYVVMKSGFSIGLGYLILVALFITLVMLYFGEITLRTKKTHLLAGYAERYLGHTGKLIAMLVFLFGAYAALLAYLIAEGESWSFLLFGNMKYVVFFALAFWMIFSFLSFKGIKTLKKSESLGVMFVLIMLLSLVLLNAKKIQLQNLASVDFSNILAPLGVVMFAYLGYSMIPEIKRILNNQVSSMKKVVITAYAIIFVIYAVFTIMVLGTYGDATPQIATLALSKPFVLLGIITIFTASLALSNALIDTFQFDFKASRAHAWMYSMLVPLALYVLTIVAGKIDFITTITIGGIISGTISLILILLMIPRAKAHGDRKPEYSILYLKLVAWLIMLSFVAGALVEIINLLSN